MAKAKYTVRSKVSLNADTPEDAAYFAHQVFMGFEQDHMILEVTNNETGEVKEINLNDNDVFP